MISFYAPALAQISLATTDWMLRDSESIEAGYRRTAGFFPHKFVSRPVYKIARSCVNPVLATAVSFFVTDLIFHQIPVELAFCAAKIGPCTIQWHPIQSAAWMAFALPVMHAKIKRMVQELQ